jgi:hypothetical protein
MVSCVRPTKGRASASLARAAPNDAVVVNLFVIADGPWRPALPWSTDSGQEIGPKVSGSSTGPLRDVDLGRPYASVQEVADALVVLEDRLVAANDKRAVFVTAYRTITLELQRRLAAGGFEDGAWVSRYLLAFANLYRRALYAYEQPGAEAVPLPWQIAFDAAAHGPALLMQHLMLGINAHINHDLALGLLEVTIDPQRESRRRDHTAVNEALKTATDPVQERLAQLYTPALTILDEMCGVLDERITNFSFGRARDCAWNAAVRLADCRDDAARTACRRGLEQTSGTLARTLLAPNPFLRPAIAGLNALERLSLRLGRHG